MPLHTMLTAVMLLLSSVVFIKMLCQYLNLLTKYEVVYKDEIELDKMEE